VKAEQVRAARGLLRWSQGDLSRRSNVSVPTIKRLEAMDGDMSGRAATIRAIQAAFEANGVVLIPENGGGAGVRLAAATAFRAATRPDDLNASNDD
jgi:transcriptional regulator with XRE-family HTH domain